MNTELRDDAVRPGLRASLNGRPRYDTVCLPVGELRVLLAEYDRRGAVEEAAAGYVMSCVGYVCGDEPELNADIAEKFTALVALVRTNGDFHG